MYYFNAICPNLKTDDQNEKRKKTNLIVHYFITSTEIIMSTVSHVRSHRWRSMWARLCLACEHRRISTRYFLGGEKKRLEIRRLVA